MSTGTTIAAAVLALPLGPLRSPLAGAGAYVVGGWIREVVAGRDPGGDVDIAVEGDLEALLDALEREAEVDVHERHRRFGTATVTTGRLRVDLTPTRRERYPRPGALPEVEHAPIAADLGRRDFTVNAMAVPLAAPGAMLDPFGGARDLRTGTLRVLHEGSFVDDPTRAIRAARYAARLGLDPDPVTLGLLAATDLDAVSADRRAAELARLAAEPAAPLGFALLAEWGVLDVGVEAVAAMAAIDALAGKVPWADDPSLRGSAIMLVAGGGQRARTALELAAAKPESPSEAVRLAAPHQPAELLLAAAAGADWVGGDLRRWQATALEINGEDLIAAGVPEGPTVGAALRGALERKLDGRVSGGREAELELALALARGASDSI